MSATAAYSLEASHSAHPRPRHIPFDQVANTARRRASKIDSDLSTTELVHRTLARFEETFGTTGGPIDLDGWVKRTLREIVVVHRRTESTPTVLDLGEVEMILKSLAAPVRAPAIAKQRKLLLRRVSEVVPGLECRVLLAMINESSLDRVADQLHASPIDVARLHRRGLEVLRDRLAHDPELAEQLRTASRQPKKARTSR